MNYNDIKNYIKTCFHICLEEKQGETVGLYTLQLWLKRSCGKNNNKDDNKYNNSKY